MKPTTGAVQAASATPDDQAPRPNDPHQLELRLFERIDAFRGRPPERALWREIVDLALKSAPAAAFVVHGRRIADAAVHHLAWVIYSNANPAGIAHASDAELALQARREPKMVSRVVTILNRIRAVHSTRDSRRGKRFHAMNLGGLSWSAIRRRAQLHRRDKTAEAADGGQQLPLPHHPSGGRTPPLSGGRTPPLRRASTLGEISDPIAAAGTPRARGAGRRQQQQQRQHDRIEGLIAAIATRSRELDMDYDERDERRRLEEGEIDVDALQRLADELRDKTRTRRLRRAHGPYGSVS